MEIINLINFCADSDFQEKYGSQVYWDISKAKKESDRLHDVIHSLQREHDNFVSFSGEEHTEQRKQDIRNAIQFLYDYSDHINIGSMTMIFVEY